MVLTGSRRLDGTVFLGSKRTTKNLPDDGTFGDGLGQGFDNGITENGLKHAKTVSVNTADCLEEYRLRTAVERRNVRPPGGISMVRKYLGSESKSRFETEIDIGCAD